LRPVSNGGWKIVFPLPQIRDSHTTKLAIGTRRAYQIDGCASRLNDAPRAVGHLCDTPRGPFGAWRYRSADCPRRARRKGARNSWPGRNPPVAPAGSQPAQRLAVPGALASHRGCRGFDRRECRSAAQQEFRLPCHVIQVALPATWLTARKRQSTRSETGWRKRGGGGAWAANLHLTRLEVRATEERSQESEVRSRTIILSPVFCLLTPPYGVPAGSPSTSKVRGIPLRRYMLVQVRPARRLGRNFDGVGRHRVFQLVQRRIEDIVVAADVIGGEQRARPDGGQRSGRERGGAAMNIAVFDGQLHGLVVDSHHVVEQIARLRPWRSSPAPRVGAASARLSTINTAIAGLTGS